MSADSIKAVMKACAQRGLRLTPLRADVLRLVTESAKPVKAYDVLSRISESDAISSPPTVYRALDFLLENGFIHKLESINSYVACIAPQSSHIATFLICDRCDAATEVIEDHVRTLLDSRSREMKFAPSTRTQTLEVHGLCKECSAARAY
ncbi:MAG TPA: transcriptional repressor [Xanthomonadaceae bacterium]|jgi:Fur family zinc uptake transcriptional regulator|nr:transcriptional repressor [Xanthomonadaceae bacterium]